MKNSIIEKSVVWLKALGNKKRLRILTALKDKEQKVGELEQIVDLSQSALSQHLAILRRAGIVSSRREAQSIYYSVKNADALKLLKIFREIFK